MLNQFGQPTEGVPVTFSVSGGTIYTGTTTTALNGQAQLPWWRYGGAGPQSITATAGAAPPVTFTATAQTVPISNYRINVSYPGRDRGSATQRGHQAGVHRRGDPLADAHRRRPAAGRLHRQRRRWARTASTPGIPGVGTVPCIPQIANQTVKDVNIYVYIRPIDGASGTNILGLATPVYAAGRHACCRMLAA